MVDDDIALLLRNNTLYLSNGYIQLYIEGKCIYLHRFILFGFKQIKSFIDHIDRNKLNNCRNNFRRCSNKNNVCNTGARKNKYKGVCLLSRDNIYCAYICCNGIRMALLRSILEHECAYSYNIAAKILQKDFAYINNINTEISNERKKEIEEFILEKLKAYANQ